MCSRIVLVIVACLAMTSCVSAQSSANITVYDNTIDCNRTFTINASAVVATPTYQFNNCTTLTFQNDSLFATAGCDPATGTFTVDLYDNATCNFHILKEFTGVVPNSCVKLDNTTSFFVGASGCVKIANTTTAPTTTAPTTTAPTTAAPTTNAPTTNAPTTPVPTNGTTAPPKNGTTAPPNNNGTTGNTTTPPNPKNNDATYQAGFSLFAAATAAVIVLATL